jgi:hypothetical protein
LKPKNAYKAVVTAAHRPHNAALKTTGNRYSKAMTGEPKLWRRLYRINVVALTSRKVRR